MAKHLLFQDGRLYAMANEDAKSDFLVNAATTVTAKTVSDEDYKSVGVKSKRATLDGDTVVYTDKGSLAADITDATEAQDLLSTEINYLIKDIKEKAQNNYGSDAGAYLRNFVAFLQNIDISAVSSWDANDNVLEYIYNLPGCPQIFVQEIYF
tara:strand:+ start:146 stop:604 length:459 start_codon:yes stop_codon:yes gene_type:complete